MSRVLLGSVVWLFSASISAASPVLAQQAVPSDLMNPPSDLPTSKLRSDYNQDSSYEPPVEGGPGSTQGSGTR
ncbi:MULTISPECIES: hypothetical protein [unclassified Leptolyngbya]|nr:MULTISPECIES: hypothetical protein [unclassified Leptolyngbya]MBD1911176.1 hypothetical protein [Leptolyngbya sp. FACHB-8]MBD2154831.1 hypothetical protein [Leptolyngbya sp. FACHB-16]